METLPHPLMLPTLVPLANLGLFVGIRPQIPRNLIFTRSRNRIILHLVAGTRAIYYIIPQAAGLMD